MENIIFIIEPVSNSVKFHMLFDDDVYDSKEEYISERLEIDVNSCIWFNATTSMEINRNKGSIGTNCDKKLLHIAGQGTGKPKIDIYDFDSSLDWSSDEIYVDILGFKDSYDDVLITTSIK